MTTGFAFSFGGVLNGLLLADSRRDNSFADEAVAFCEEQDLRAYIPWAHFYKGLALGRNGRPLEGIEQMRVGMAGAQQIRMEIARSMHLGHMADIHRCIGELEVAQELLEESHCSRRFQRRAHIRSGALPIASSGVS
jgi:hypothetical protein